MEAVRICAVGLSPVTPRLSKRIYLQLGYTEDEFRELTWVSASLLFKRSYWLPWAMEVAFQNLRKDGNGPFLTLGWKSLQGSKSVCPEAVLG